MSADTLYAPAERVGDDQARAGLESILGDEEVVGLLNALPYLAAILDEHRQIFFANSAVLDLLKVDDIEQVVGARPGEAIGCVHAGEHPGGCGTAEACRYCGAVNTVLESRRTGERAEGECRITTRDGSGMDLSLTAVPFKIAGGDYTLLALQDISDEKRRKGLERVFFHDVINTAQSMYAAVQYLGLAGEEADLGKEIERLSSASETLLDEIGAQRDLLYAESGELPVIDTEIGSARLLKSVANLIARHDVASGKKLEVAGDTADVTFASDDRLVKRILTNMTKNALEASGPGATVTLGCDESGGKVRFRVHNEAVMPREVELQVFQRSFSTKEKGRGLGTYSMKLLGERYLGGRVWFTTVEGEGTTFFLELPGERGDAEEGENDGGR